MNSDRAWAIAIAVLFAAITFWWFPGHTFLQSDTQVYIPILQHIEDSSVLAKDEMAVRPHVGFTLYDELLLGLRRVTGLPFDSLLLSLQLVIRALGIAGVFLFARAIGLERWFSAVVAGLLALGATVNGPQVLAVEYEPVPRGFALGLLLFGLGLFAQKHYRWTAVVCTVAFALHPPTALVLWLLYAGGLVVERRWTDVAIMSVGPVLLLLTRTGGIIDGRIDAELESILRMRASYNWVDTWIGKYWVRYALLLVAAVAGGWLIRHPLRWVLIALPVIGAVSVGASWLVLEQGKWFLGAQFQPARYLLYVPLFAALNCALAGRRFWPLLAVPLFVVISDKAPAGQTPDLHELVQWARSSTPKDAVFQFADVRRGLEPGVFRVQAERAIYADWKAGGQVNFSPEFAKLWAARWKQIERAKPLSFYGPLGIDYVVFSLDKAPKGVTPVWANQRWAVFRTSASTSARVGIEDWAPARVTEIAAAALANVSAASSTAPSVSATASAALKVSPAAVVSTASTLKPGT